MSRSLEDWERALRGAVAEVHGPAAAVAAGLEALRSRAPGERTPALAAYAADLEEGLLLRHLGRLAIPETHTTPRGQALPQARDLPLQIDDFQLTELLGAGGMGRVYRAREQTLGRDVALKLLDPDVLSELGGRQRFLREARALAAINDPNVVTCFRLGEAEGIPFLAMELLAGDARGLLQDEGGRLSEEHVLALGLDAARGLEALGRVGLVHRDLKPSNLLLDAQGRVKLGDLGLARRESGEDRLTLTGAVIGTPAFMAPEQLRGETELDARADVFGLGATLWNLLVGRPPTLARELGQVEVSRRTEALLRRALAMNPDERFPDAVSLRRALEECAQSEEGGGEDLRALGLVGGAGALLLAGVAAVFLGRGEPPAPSPPPSALASASSSALPAESPETTIASRPEVAARTVSPPAPAASPSPSPSPSPEPTLVAPTPTPSLAASPEPAASPAWTRLEPQIGATGETGNWRRWALLDTAPRRAPLRVRWTCTARSERDASGPVLPHHGFEVGAGYFFELALRTGTSEVFAAKDLGAAIWLSLQVLADGSTRALVRRTNDEHLPGRDLDLAGTPGLALLGRFSLARRELDPGQEFEVELAATREGWSLVLQQGGERVHRSAGAWVEGGAPWRAPLERDLYVWSHHGEWAEGRGQGTIATEVR